MGFSRQEYWSGLPFPSPEDLPDPVIEPGPPALQADTLPLSHRVHYVKCWLGEVQAVIKIARRNISNLRYVDDTTLMEESEEELKSFLMKVKEDSEKASLKLNIKK